LIAYELKNVAIRQVLEESTLCEEWIRIKAGATVVAGSESGGAGIDEMLRVRIRCEAGIPHSMHLLN